MRSGSGSAYPYQHRRSVHPTESGLVWRSGSESPPLPVPARVNPAGRRPTTAFGGGETAGLADGPNPVPPDNIAKFSIRV
jgi:hypothetical protein